jgi:hypothetical protein
VDKIGAPGENYNGDDKITELRIITVCNLSIMLWTLRYQWGSNSNVMKYYIFVLGLHIWSDQGVRVIIVALIAHLKFRRVSAVPSLPNSVSLLSVIYRLCYDDQIIVQQGLDIYHEGTADTLRNLRWAIRATIITRTDNTMAKWKSAIILEISSSKNIHLKQQLPYKFCWWIQSEHPEITKDLSQVTLLSIHWNAGYI